MLNFYTVLWFFFIYAFLGWCTEVCYAALRLGKFVNRGFLNGPICPIYGFGVVGVVALLTPVKERILLLFVCSVLLTSALEWITGFVLEKLFHQKWWDYSDMPFNLNGYICPMFSLMWGFACLIIMDMVHPVVAVVVEHIPTVVGIVVLCVLSAVALVDMAATVKTMVGLNKRLRQIDELASKIKSASNELGENLSAATITITEKGSGLKENLNDLKEDLAEKSADVRENLADFREDLADLREDLADFKEDLVERGADLKEGLTERVAAQKAESEMRRTARGAALKRREAALAELNAANEELLSTYGYGQRRLLRAFPQMTSTRYAAAMEEVRERLHDMRKNSK